MTSRLRYLIPEPHFGRAGVYWIADHVQMTALTRALKMDVNVAYLDGRSPNGKVDFVEFRDPDSQLENSTPITLLYRWVSQHLSLISTMLSGAK